MAADRWKLEESRCQVRFEEIRAKARSDMQQMVSYTARLKETANELGKLACEARKAAEELLAVSGGSP